ncbi:MAG: methylated-DNA--[protein]-cysteine S-methyltransferase [Alphaproteobacteria bacterium]|nr:methylated-DNA--[protein]-cysteine S-methyltransferase [Alphaproteobacteria bacterium]
MKKIIYGIHEISLGQVVIAKSGKGLFWLGFMVGLEQGAYKGDGLARLKQYQEKYYSAADLIRDNEGTKALMKEIIKAWEDGQEKKIRLDLQGTDFQKQVWSALLNISKGTLKTYGEIANDIDRSKAMRAVGTAVGENPVSLIVPCHRVVPASGGVGNYGWGAALKKRILEKEHALSKIA